MILLGILAAVLVAGGITAFFMLRDDEKPAAPPAPATQPAPTPKRTPVSLPGPTTAVSASELLKAYNDDPNKADELYKGKVLDVTGTVLAAKRDVLEKSFVALEGGTDRIRGVRCILSPENDWQVETTERFQTVTVRGRCQGILGDVVLHESAVMP